MGWEDINFECKFNFINVLSFFFMERDILDCFWEVRVEKFLVSMKVDWSLCFTTKKKKKKYCFVTEPFA